MELNLNNKVDNKQEQNSEMIEFMNELNSVLEREQELESNGTLYNEIFNDVELAQKYVNELQNTIDKCLNNLSYERDFFYFDYDKETREYNLKYYCDGGSIICDNLTKEDIEEFKRSKFTFFEPFDEEGTIRESDTLKDWMKCEVENALLDLDIKNRESKGK